VRTSRSNSSPTRRRNSMTRAMPSEDTNAW
jgi:hypothetical protein